MSSKTEEVIKLSIMATVVTALLLDKLTDEKPVSKEEVKKIMFEMPKHLGSIFHDVIILINMGLEPDLAIDMAILKLHSTSDKKEEVEKDWKSHDCPNCSLADTCEIKDLVMKIKTEEAKEAILNSNKISKN